MFFVKAKHKSVTFVVHFAGVAQLVEHQPSKLRVAGSSLVSRSTAYIAQAVEHFLGKEEVTSSSLVVGSMDLVDIIDVSLI